MLPLLLLALVVSTATAGEVDVLWAACQQDSICQWVFRHDGYAGMARVATYNTEMIANARPFPYFPASWQAAAVVNSTAQLLLERQLNGLVRYRAFIESSTLTCLPGESVVYNPITRAFACVCQPGKKCVTTADFTAATADALRYGRRSRPLSTCLRPLTLFSASPRSWLLSRPSSSSWQASPPSFTLSFHARARLPSSARSLPRFSRARRTSRDHFSDD